MRLGGGAEVCPAVARVKPGHGQPGFCSGQDWFVTAGSEEETMHG